MLDFRLFNRGAMSGRINKMRKEKDFGFLKKAKQFRALK